LGGEGEESEKFEKFEKWLGVGCWYVAWTCRWRIDERVVDSTDKITRVGIHQGLSDTHALDGSA
jgi:hypothetical protein